MSPSASEPIQILVAEDEPVSRHLLERSLLGWGYAPVICCDGEEAWHTLQRDGAPRIAVLDWMMPNMDGLAVCRAVRAAGQAIEPYLIILTAHTGQENVVRGLQAGADDYLTKPVDHGELEMRLQVAVRVVSLQQRLAERVVELEAALGRVRQLHGLLPICAYCKRIRDDRNYWSQLETYLGEHSDLTFSHGICPNCLERVMSESNEPER
jgi:sigma-B regulation protein RsbU (phosphoserine phosphatase)